MYAIRQLVGRLHLLEFRAPVTSLEMTDFISDIRSLLRGVAEPLVLLSDCRESDAWPDDAFDASVWAMRMDNPSLVANVFLVAADTPVEAQMRALIAQGQSEARHVVTNIDAARTLLEPVLLREERAALNEYLG